MDKHAPKILRLCLVLVMMSAFASTDPQSNNTDVMSNLTTTSTDLVDISNGTSTTEHQNISSEQDDLTSLLLSTTAASSVGTVDSSTQTSDTNLTDLDLGGIDGQTSNMTGLQNVTDAAEDTPPPRRVNPYAIIHTGIMSKQQFDTCSLVINVGLKPIVSIAGVVMNTIGAVVLCKKQFRRSTYTYLFFLSIADCCLLLNALVRSIPRFVILFDGVLANHIDMKTFLSNEIFLNAVFSRISEYVICALALERFFAVFYPLKVKQLFLCRHAMAICLCIVGFCIFTHSHYLFIYYPKPYFSTSVNATLYSLGRRAWYTETGFQTIYNYIYEFLYFYTPIIILVVCNSGTLLKVRMMNKRRREMVANNDETKMSADQLRMTTTLLIISLNFVVVFLPIVVLTIIQKFDGNIKLYGREHYLVYFLIDLLSFGWVISSANDFVVYVFTSKQFKDALFEMFCGKRKMKYLESNDVKSKDTDSTNDGSAQVPVSNHI